MRLSGLNGAGTVLKDFFFANRFALCAIINRYRPDLLDYGQVVEGDGDAAVNRYFVHLEMLLRSSVFTVERTQIEYIKWI